jgi:homoserine kinase type II
MSVFTTLNLEEARTWLRDFAIGEIVELRGIAAGITNTNYFVVTPQNKYVLTIFEKNTLNELHYFADLMTFFSQHAVLCPLPIADKNGVSLHILKNKPAMMVSCLNGTDILTPTQTQIQQVATGLANMHVAGQRFKQPSINQRDEKWRVATAQKVMSILSAADQKLLQSELDYQHALDVRALPHGVVHGDLFRDNVLFDGDNLGGFIDFYYACDDVLLYDVAIAVNEWCLHHTGSDIGSIDEEKMQTFLSAYQAIRPFSQQEWKCWLAMLRRAALRFWLSRLHDFYFPQDGELTHTKDPNHFKKILQQYIDYADDLGEQAQE